MWAQLLPLELKEAGRGYMTGLGPDEEDEGEVRTEDYADISILTDLEHDVAFSDGKLGGQGGIKEVKDGDVSFPFYRVRVDGES